MGLGQEEAAPTEEGRLTLPEQEAEQGAKTIGKQRTQTE